MSTPTRPSNANVTSPGSPVDRRKPRVRLLWIAASILVIVLPPLVLHEGLSYRHHLAFRGICGPHAPDIPAHPCSYGQYMAEFDGGFAGIALMLIEGLLAAGTAFGVAAAWAVWFLATRQRRRQTLQP